MIEVVLGFHIAFLIVTWIVIGISIRNAPSDVELWGEEID